MKKIIFASLLLFSIFIFGCARITNFEQCAAAGNSIMESYPRQCIANGKTFTEEINNDQKGIKYAMIEIPKEYSGYDKLLNGDTCIEFCTNNAQGKVVVNDTAKYCKCPIPTGI